MASCAERADGVARRKGDGRDGGKEAWESKGDEQDRRAREECTVCHEISYTFIHREGSRGAREECIVCLELSYTFIRRQGSRGAVSACQDRLRRALALHLDATSHCSDTKPGCFKGTEPGLR